MGEGGSKGLQKIRHMELAQRETGKLVKVGLAKLKGTVERGLTKATSKNSVALFYLSFKILHKHCFHFLLGLTMVPGENYYCRILQDKQRILWYS